MSKKGQIEYFVFIVVLLICMTFVVFMKSNHCPSTSNPDVQYLIDRVNEQTNEIIELEQMFMDTLPQRKNCIDDKDCIDRTNTFLDDDCRFFYYFWKDTYYDRLDGNGFCNFESGEFLWSMTVNGKPHWVNSDGYTTPYNKINLEVLKNE